MKIGYQRREKLVMLLKTIIFFVVGIAFLTPLFWMISTSLKTTSEIMDLNFSWIPKNPRWNNYVEIWTEGKVNMTNGYINSAIIVLLSISVSLTFSSLAAYAFAKIKFKGSALVFTLFLSTMMIPTEVTLIPKFVFYQKLNLYNNHFAIILPHWFNASAMFLLRQFYMGLPDDLMEAAKIDGAGHVRIFGQVMLPLTKSALISQCVLSFVSVWNEYLAPLIFLADQKLYTVSQVVQWTMLDESQRQDLTMCAATSAIVPAIIIFILCQKVFIEGIATSGVKG